MEKKENCPFFKDHTRECIIKIKVIPGNTYDYCLTKKFRECPFYKSFTGKRFECENMRKCALYARFLVADFEEFVRMAESYCFSENCRNCKRYQLKKTGRTVPDNLLPDGGELQVEGTVRKASEAKMNCWEVQKCGREPGGARAAEFGICPAAVEVRANGINGGKNGGRACWAIAGTFCGGKVQGTFAKKHSSCIECEFYKLVTSEEDRCMIATEILKKMEGSK